MIAALLIALTANSEMSLYRSCAEIVVREAVADPGSEVHCRAYFQGWALGYAMGQFSIKSGKLCLPGGLNPDQAMRVYVDYVSRNPAEMHEDENTLLTRALMLAFPCPPQE